jgi:hypothetical protein
MEPFPLMKTRQPVDASTRFRELPLGPRMRPTKLNCGRSENYIGKEIAMDQALSCVNIKLQVRGSIHSDKNQLGPPSVESSLRHES